MAKAVAEASPLCSLFCGESEARLGDVLAGLVVRCEQSELTFGLSAQLARWTASVTSGALADVNQREAVQTGELTPPPATDNQPPINQRLPPRERRTKQRSTTSCLPEPNWKGNATEIKANDPTLKPLPTNANHDLTTPDGSTLVVEVRETWTARRYQFH